MKPRENILNTARDLTCTERNVSYGEPFQNLSDIAALWNAYLISKYRGMTLDENQFQITAEDVAWMNVFIKTARSFKANTFDNYVDAAAYAAIAGECREEQEND